jgi:primosomal protein N' (replication factor Y)
MPTIDVIDLRRYPRIAAHKPEPSEPLLKALSAQIERGEQGLVLLNRRGYSPVLRCNGCGWVAGCPRCSARFVLHQRQHTLRCHHCGQAERPPRTCPTCGNPDLTALGLGTERLEETLARLLPGARILRIDRDTVRTAAAWEQARERIRKREVDLLVGTQMLAKGHDFPRLTLVGVVDSDQALYSSDFRAPERLFALLTQVAGRAGRADLPGRVMIETAIPQHPLFSALARHDYATFACQLLDERRQMRLPPFSSQAILRADAPALADAIEFLAAAAALAPDIDPSITVYDPVPALLVRRASRERAQLLVQSANRGRFQRFLALWRQSIAAQRQSKVHWILDVDPLEL